jgi:hypothetical protein
LTTINLSPPTDAWNGVLSAVAYDDKHDVYLHVNEDSRRVMGRFLMGQTTCIGLIALPTTSPSSGVKMKWFSWLNRMISQSAANRRRRRLAA